MRSNYTDIHEISGVNFSLYNVCWSS